MFKKKYVRFVNEIPGVEITHPVVPAKQFKHKWMSNLNKDVVSHNNACPVSATKGNTARCPGIIDLHQTGFIVPAPFDFVITTNGSKENFEWLMHIDPAMVNKDIKQPYISLHPKEQLHNYSPPREDSLDVIIKVNTYWKLLSSDDIVFLQMPIPYPDHNIFTACHGIIDSNKYNALNLQLQWHKINGEHLIKAGTPLCQLVPMPKDFAVDLLVDKITEDDIYASKAYSYVTMHEFTKDTSRWKKSVKTIMDKLRKSINRS